MEWSYCLDGQATQRQAEAIADLVESRIHKPEIWPPWVGRRTPLNLIRYWINGLLGRDFDTPLLNKHNGVPVDFLGQRDKVVTQQDVGLWTTKIRKMLSSTERY